ncbi:DUF3152 domain-containing protein [Bifidobacterium amazonense]|uniref:DUF3152 domain-containing protein n=1 Tax=Bifidobacterium amazonense TaxID=2809027 RepID=A0ABS9VS35_9BIFI|nr:DUF3152 domain-containing protein [Bifidobacterium amazonense]MCH9274893.1 DUF3152 domain-containing protein [Bifidobacterium amazonense]
MPRFTGSRSGPVGTFIGRFSREPKYVIRRVAVVVLIVAFVAAVVWSTAIAGGALERVRAQSADVAAAKGGTSASSSNKSAKSTDGKSQAAADADQQAADIAATLKSDKSAKPLTDAERTSILQQAQSTAADSGDVPQTFTYCLETKGDVGSTTAFSNTVYRTLNNAKGWPRAGATFEQLNGDDCANADMTLILSEAKYMSDFSEGCSGSYSCRVGDQVIINADRWNGGTEDWLKAGGTLARYREMVINHEVGHRLGHYDNETACAGEGQPAPLMLQQSMRLDGCTPNEWPLDSELWIGWHRVEPELTRLFSPDSPCREEPGRYSMSVRRSARFARTRSHENRASASSRLMGVPNGSSASPAGRSESPSNRAQ